MEKKSMSVREMGKILGLCKTEAYYLVKKNYFETRIVGKNMRVMVASFEEWYNGQFHYKKVDGNLPGMKYGDTISISDVGKMLGLSSGGAYWVVDHSDMEVRVINGVRRIPRKSFLRWYESQDRYTMVESEVDSSDGIDN